uniref:Uncharacterized protein n=1 Tax=Glossina morsitans morsitans TaxID=37546 RepID=A0A1B0GE78_GLOMM
MAGMALKLMICKGNPKFQAQQIRVRKAQVRPLDSRLSQNKSRKKRLPCLPAFHIVEPSFHGIYPCFMHIDERQVQARDGLF